MAERITTVCGSTIFVKIRQTKEKGTGIKRKARKNPTLESVMLINQRNAEIDLSMKLNHNFVGGDVHAVLTYKELLPKEKMKKELDKFIRALRRRMRTDEGKELKLIHATEYENARPHHHIVCNVQDIHMLEKLWSAGWIKTSVLDDSRDYRKLAEYIIKETSKTFRNPDAFMSRRYSCTRSIKTPASKVEEVSAARLVADPRPIKGYYIDRDSVYRGENPFSGMPYLEYVMISDNAETPRLTHWRRGKTVKRKDQNYSGWIRQNMPQQLVIGDL